MKYPLIDLYAVLQNQQITILVGEATDSHCDGTLTVFVADTNAGQPFVLTQKVTSLGTALQFISFSGFPLTGKLHPVMATLILNTGESKNDNEIILLK